MTAARKPARSGIDIVLGDAVICDCGATIQSYVDKCHAATNEACQGLRRIEKTRSTINEDTIA